MPKREQLEALLRDDPDDVFLMYAVAMAYVAEGDTSQGLARLKAVIEQHPDYVAAYFQSAQLLAAEGENEPAGALLRQGIEVAQRVGDSHAAMEMTGFLETL